MRIPKLTLNMLALLTMNSGLTMSSGVTSSFSAVENDCTSSCYQKKSQAYQRCREISPSDRKARHTCFEQSDRLLERCLAACSAEKK